MKKVIYIRTTNIYDDSRATKEILTLANSEYSILVLGWNRDGKALGECERLFSDKKNIDFHFFEMEAASGIGLKNIDKLIKWLIWLRKELKAVKDISIIHACNLDSGIGLNRYCKKKKIKLVYDIYDYYIDSHAIPKRIISLVEKQELKLIDSSDLTIICTEERMQQISKSSPKKVIVIHNSPEIIDINKKIKYDYAYCGSLCDKRLIKEIINEHRNNQNINMVFAGNDKYFQFACNAQGEQSNFTFLGTIPYQKVLEVESQARVLSAIYEPTIRNHKLCAPNKFYEALALGKPIIVCKGTGIDKIVERYNLGIAINYDANEFYEALNELLGNEELRDEISTRSKKLYEERYKWSIMQKILIDAYSQL